jgi:NADH-quinone oxidoreductase subunit H
MWLRWTLPRVRIDQVLYTCVQVMLPLVMLLLLGHTVYELLVPVGGALFTTLNIILSVIGAVIVLAALSVVVYGFWNRRRLVGYLGVDLLPGA